MLTPIEDEPPVNGPSTPILIGSAAKARPAERASAATAERLKECTLVLSLVGFLPLHSLARRRAESAGACSSSTPAHVLTIPCRTAPGQTLSDRAEWREGPERGAGRVHGRRLAGSLQVLPRPTPVGRAPRLLP